MKKKSYKNWKLKEIKEDFDIISNNSIPFIDKILKQLNLPVPTNSDNGLYRGDTNIDWTKMPNYFKFFFDNDRDELKIQKWFERSKLREYDKIIIPYGWNEPVIEVSTELFFNDWEGFIRSTLWETIIFSSDYKLIMEVSRDYYIHSNFRIAQEKA